MSNFLAVAAATYTLKSRFERLIDELVPGAVVSVERPEAEPPGIDKHLPRINLYPYQVAANPTFRNSDLPTRDSAGSPTQDSRAAFDVHYLLSFFGESLKGQILLGIASSHLHAYPYLTPEEIEQATQGTPFDKSGLAEQEVWVRLTPLSLSLEELTKFWSGFFQVPYTLSLAYRASVILLDLNLHPKPVPSVAKVVAGRPQLLKS